MSWASPVIDHDPIGSPPQAVNTADGPANADTLPVAELVLGSNESRAAAEAVLPGRRPGQLRRFRSWLTATAWHVWCLASLVVLLAFVTAIPLLQLTVLGYLLLVAGRLAGGRTIRESVPGRETAGRIGIVLASLGIASLPIQLLVHWESVATIIEPESTSASTLRMVSISLAMLTTVYLWWAWARGGKLRHFLWPQPLRFFREAWRPALWSDVSDRLWRTLAGLRLPMLFWLGVRGAVGTLIWLIPAMVIMSVTREGKAAGAGLVGAIALLSLGYVLLRLPFLQAHFAAENHFRAMFHWRRIRLDLWHAPWSYAGALFVTLVMLPIPLYLLKIEATMQAIAWLPCLVFVAFMLPARIATGLVLRRCRRLHRLHDAGELPALTPWRGRWQWFSRVAVRFVIAPGIVAFYLLVLGASQFTSWDGIETWTRQHALLVPVPFVGL